MFSVFSIESFVHAIAGSTVDMGTWLCKVLGNCA